MFEKAQNLTKNALEIFENSLDGENPLNFSYGGKSQIELEREKKTK